MKDQDRFQLFIAENREGIRFRPGSNPGTSEQVRMRQYNCERPRSLSKDKVFLVRIAEQVCAAIR